MLHVRGLDLKPEVVSLDCAELGDSKRGAISRKVESKDEEK